MSDGGDYSDADSRESYRPNGVYVNPPPPADGQPYLEIVEQPQSRGFRFRYQCEGKSHGGLQGENSRRERKTYPSVKICRYRGPAKLTVSLVTDEKVPQPHAHELIGKNCTNGVCTVSIKGGDQTVVSFPNLGIRHVTKKSVTTIVMERLRELAKAEKMMMTGNLGQDPDLIPLAPEEEAQIQKMAEAQAKNMPLSVVRLSFRAYLQNENAVCMAVLPPVISNPIFDSKAPSAALLKICRMDKVGGCCAGNEEVFLLCDKVQKDDVAVRFYELDDDGAVKWEDYGVFAPHDVHRQYAVVFRTPSYVTTAIDRPVTVHVQLKRMTDGEVSDPKTFTYYPQQTDLEDIQKKRKKQIPNFTDEEPVPMATGGTSGHMDWIRYLQANLNLQVGNTNGFASARPVQPVQNNVQAPRMVQVQPTGYQMYPVMAGGSRLEEDSVATGPMLLGRSWPVEQFDPAKAEPRVGSPSHKANAMEPQMPPSDEQQKPTKEEVPKTVETTQSQDPVWLAALVRLFERSSLSIQRYSETGDVRHLLMPSRHLISDRNDDGDNAVHLSVIHSQNAAIRNLLAVLSTLPSNAATINERNELLQTPLQLAVITHQSELVELLLAHGADPSAIFDHRSGNSLLHLAARDGDNTCLVPLLRRWSDNKTSSKWHPGIDTLNFEGFSALHLAVRGGHLETVRLLIQMGHADVNLADGRCGRTALHHAVNSDNLSIVGFLILECSADVDKPDDSGNTPLHHAASTRKLGVAALLMAAGANPDAENCEWSESDSDTDEETDAAARNETDNTEEIKSGLTPRDLADENQKMLKILDGDTYSSVSETYTPVSTDITVDSFSSTTSIGSMREPRLRSIFDSGIDSINLRDSSRYTSLAAGDMNKLDALARVKLSKLLDPVKTGSDWRELAGRLKLGISIRGLEMQKSPTKALLDNYEVADGTVLELRKCLLEMNRTDAVDLVDSTLQST